MGYTQPIWNTKRIENSAGKCAYTDHEEMTPSDVSYILTVADANNIAKIPIGHINDFINLVEE